MHAGGAVGSIAAVQLLEKSIRVLDFAIGSRRREVVVESDQETGIDQAELQKCLKSTDSKNPPPRLEFM